MRVLEVDPIHRRIVLAVTSIPAEQPPRPAEPSKIHTDEDLAGVE
jgi:small subunit ribosomal protein S1